jgi:transcriptional regulator with PAS, ATPase and Fis domain
VAINCAALPETLLESELFGYVKGAFTGANRFKKGLFESADGGTLLLDEVGTIPINMQLTLLRVLQEHEIRPVGATENIPVDVRIIAATNEDLEEKIRRGLFREDLYYRISVIPLRLPPLRERLSDIPLLVNHFLEQICEQETRKIEISPEALLALDSYAWPGNVRELENVIRRAAALCDQDRIGVENLPEQVRKYCPVKDSQSRTEDVREFGTVSLRAFLRSQERQYIRQVLARCDNDKERAASLLGVSLATFYRKYSED